MASEHFADDTTVELLGSDQLIVLLLRAMHGSQRCQNFWCLNWNEQEVSVKGRVMILLKESSFARPLITTEKHFTDRGDHSQIESCKVMKADVQVPLRSLMFVIQP